MTIKNLAHSVQQYLQSHTGSSFKRAHIYEMLAASFGFNSYAAFTSNSIFSEKLIFNQRPSTDEIFLRNRCVEIGYLPEVAKNIAVALPIFLIEHKIGVIKITELVAHLRFESEVQNDDNEEGLELDDGEYVSDDNWENISTLSTPILMDGIEGAASKGNALAHYALALIFANDDAENEQEVGSEHWYQQAKGGRVLSGIEKEWADTYEDNLHKTKKYTYHLREAARLGQQDALLELAERFDDPTFFEQAGDQVNSDPALIAGIAERLGRYNDVRKWLTIAAEAGDIEAMCQLIDEYDHGDLQRCWTWVYLAEFLGKDITKDEHYAIGDDGLPYDDDVGGNVYVGGSDGIEIIPLDANLDIIARNSAREIFQRISAG